MHFDWARSPLQCMQRRVGWMDFRLTQCCAPIYLWILFHEFVESPCDLFGTRGEDDTRIPLLKSLRRTGFFDRRSLYDLLQLVPSVFPNLWFRFKGTCFLLNCSRCWWKMFRGVFLWIVGCFAQCDAFWWDLSVSHLTPDNWCVMTKDGESDEGEHLCGSEVEIWSSEGSKLVTVFVVENRGCLCVVWLHWLPHQTRVCCAFGFARRAGSLTFSKVTWKAKGSANQAGTFLVPNRWWLPTTSALFLPPNPSDPSGWVWDESRQRFPGGRAVTSTTAWKQSSQERRLCDVVSRNTQQSSLLERLFIRLVRQWRWKDFQTPVPDEGQCVTSFRVRWPSHLMWDAMWPRLLVFHWSWRHNWPSTYLRNVSWILEKFYLLSSDTVFLQNVYTTEPGLNSGESCINENTKARTVLTWDIPQIGF